MIAMRPITIICAVLLLTVPAVGQDVFTSYSGMVEIDGKPRELVMHISRNPLVEGRESNRRIVGWRYLGVGWVYDTANPVKGQFEKYFEVIGVSDGVTHSIADSVNVTLRLKNDVDSASLQRRFDNDGTYSWSWQFFSGDIALQQVKLTESFRSDDDENSDCYSLDFPVFWNDFSDALRTHDRNRLASMIRFPMRGKECFFRRDDPPLPAQSGLLNRKTFIDKFDKIFDDSTAHRLMRIDPMGVSAQEYFLASEPWAPKLSKGTMLYTVTPEDQVGWSFQFARVGDRYQLVYVTCAMEEGC